MARNLEVLIRIEMNETDAPLSANFLKMVCFCGNTEFSQFCLRKCKCNVDEVPCPCNTCVEIDSQLQQQQPDDAASDWIPAEFPPTKASASHARFRHQNSF